MDKGKTYKITVLRDGIEVIQANKKPSEIFKLISGQVLTGVYQFTTKSGYSCFNVQEFKDEVCFPQYSFKTEVVA